MPAAAAAAAAGSLPLPRLLLRAATSKLVPRSLKLISIHLCTVFGYAGWLANRPAFIHNSSLQFGSATTVVAIGKFMSAVL